MSVSAVPRRRVLVLIPLLLIALLAWSATRSDTQAAPASAKTSSASEAGKIAFDSLPGPVASTLPLRSFVVGGANSSVTGGGGSGAGKFVPDDPTVVLDASDVDPLLLRVVTTGVHLQHVTVTLFRPGTTARQEVWLFDTVSFSELRTAQSGSAKAPRVTLGLHYARVKVTTYDAQGAVVGSFCFAVDASMVC